MSYTKKTKTNPEVREAIQAALDKHEATQAHLLSMSEIGKLLGLNPYQLVRAKQTGKLPTKRLDVATLADVQAFAEQHLITDKNGKPRIAAGQ
ncbi:hypothetical protein GCM10022631_22200 [Deinococcus rubellus]|uniref:DNA-binding protein n=1 Tax=Deinococcus rubellus TaxID=1889240 RepID=A0ABY5YHJ6_9DEIO|nr:hypothetical protein [Deinococcus rubellus]UWX64285.1 hypothetical protein N0D28_01000 [Deinococcus rubellus]